jgi:hypothetical protein
MADFATSSCDGLDTRTVAFARCQRGWLLRASEARVTGRLAEHVHFVLGFVAISDLGRARHGLCGEVFDHGDTTVAWLLSATAV